MGLPTANAIMPDGNDVQSRPLRNLISYLKQKEAAGVISMTGGPMVGKLLIQKRR